MEQSQEYASGLKDVLIRKINKTERNLVSLKLDYCRFIYGLSNRSKVLYDGVVYQVVSLNLDIMDRSESGDWSKPGVMAIKYQQGRRLGDVSQDEMIDLGQHWDSYHSD